MLQHNAAKSFVAIMIVIAVSAFCLRIAIDQFMRMTIERNESDASAALKLISTALENYAKDNKNSFPGVFKDLVKTSPPYLAQDFISGPALKGYTYGCARLDTQGYSCTATPVSCGLTGKNIFTVTTGGYLTAEQCQRKE